MLTRAGTKKPKIKEEKRKKRKKKALIYPTLGKVSLTPTPFQILDFNSCNLVTVMLLNLCLSPAQNWVQGRDSTNLYLALIFNQFYCRISFDFCVKPLEPNFDSYRGSFVFNLVIFYAVEGLQMAPQTDPKKWVF